MDATKTLPASWYCSQNLYQLEQRAVFHKAWYFVGAVPRFAVDRDVEYEFAGVAINVHHDGDERFTVTRVADVCMRIYDEPLALQFFSPLFARPACILARAETLTSRDLCTHRTNSLHTI